MSDSRPPVDASAACLREASDWIVSHRFTASGGLVAEARRNVGPEQVFQACDTLPHVLFLDSALADDAVLDDRAGPGRAAGGDAAPRLGRYSFVAADPILSLRVDAPAGPADLADLSARVRGLLADLATPTIPGLPPFQGGVAGAISYDFGLARLGLVPPAGSLSRMPLASLHVYDLVFAFDHLRGHGWFISQGMPAAGIPARRARARDRLEQWLARLAAGPVRSGGAVAVPPAARPVTAPGATYGLPAHPGVRSTHSPERYRAMVAAGIEYVRAGDIFQANLAQQFVVDAAVDPRALVAAAHAINPAPFAGAIDTGPTWLVSMSPERFLQVRGRSVRMHPIKGTRRRIASPEADLYAGEDLEASGKDRAENVMIVDLVRNDLARVCTAQSVRVEALCRLERYRYVQHLVSVVSGRLRPGLGALDAFEAAIPAGSVTGAPKHRACEIISELEGTSRGAYCGSLGYVGFDGAADFNLLIRTLVVEPGRVTFAAGGGVTAASDPAAEHAESLHKAEGLLRVLAAVRAADEGAVR